MELFTLFGIGYLSPQKPKSSLFVRETLLFSQLLA
jgi:hypothetical protein